MKAAFLFEPNTPLQIEELSLRKLRSREVLLGSDSHMAHFFLSETFVPYRGLVPGLRP